MAIDGSKMLANASKPSAVSHGHAEKTLRTLDPEIAELLAKANQAEATPPQDGLTIRAEFAKAALPSAIQEAEEWYDMGNTDTDVFERAAGCAVMFADALIAELNKEASK